VLLDGVLALAVVHQIAGNQQALAALLLDHLLGVLGVGLLLGQVDDADVGAFARVQDGDGPADAGADRVSSLRVCGCEGLLTLRQ
jgi:hypothetical protein